MASAGAHATPVLSRWERGGKTKEFMEWHADNHRFREEKKRIAEEEKRKKAEEEKRKKTEEETKTVE